MSVEQRKFYAKVEKSLRSGRYEEVGENISYVFTYLYKVLNGGKEFSRIYNNVLHIGDLYYFNEKLASYCKRWAGDCLLAERKYDDYLEMSTSKLPVWRKAPNSVVRVNLCRVMGVDPLPKDVMQLWGGRKSGFSESNEELLIDALGEVLSEMAAGQSIYDSLLLGGNIEPGDMYLFAGSTRFEVLPDKIFWYDRIEGCVQLSKKVWREAENKARESIGVPKIGEGWVSETALFRKVESEFPMTTVIQHGRPRWLGRQHFDIWIPEWKVAIEYHGAQHFRPVDFFGGEEAFKRNVERDERKLKVARENNTKLFVVTESDDYEDVVRLVREHHESQDYSL